MRAVRNAPPTVQVVDIDEPADVGRLVHVASVGICASDLNYLRWGSTQIAGHEFAGTLDDGTAVAVQAIWGCDSCSQCDSGNPNRCEAGVQGLGILDPGGMSERYRVPDRALVPLPGGLSVSDACLVEPASVARHACLVGGVSEGSRVAVIGAGAIGILAAAGAQDLGAGDVAVAARHPHQHEARERIGASEPGEGYDLVIDSAGTESSLHQAVTIARPGGTVVHLGIWSPIEWPMNEAFHKEVAIRPSLGYCGHHGNGDFAGSAAMLAARPELIDTLITHRFPIDDAPEAFRVAEDRSNGVFRVVVEPGGGR